MYPIDTDSDRIVLVVARGVKTGCISIDGKIPWKRPADMRRFKKLTMGGVLIMGRKTFDTIGKPLPERQIFVVTRTPQSRSWKSVCDFPSYDLACSTALKIGSPVFVCGGEEIYRLSFESEEFYPRCLDVTDVSFEEEESVFQNCARPEDRRYFDGWWFDMVSHIIKDKYELDQETTNDDDPTLVHKFYTRKRTALK